MALNPLRYIKGNLACSQAKGNSTYVTYLSNTLKNLHDIFTRIHANDAQQKIATNILTINPYSCPKTLQITSALIKRALTEKKLYNWTKDVTYPALFTIFLCTFMELRLLFISFKGMRSTSLTECVQRK